MVANDHRALRNHVVVLAQQGEHDFELAMGWTHQYDITCSPMCEA